jgi:chromosome partitioning protein
MMICILSSLYKEHKMIIVIGHSKGGVGKSTLSWNLANGLRPANVRIIDLDFQQTLFIINEARKQNKSLVSKIAVLQPNSAEELLHIFEDDFKGYTVVDLGGYDNDINRIALSKADTVIIPISESITDFIGFDTFIDIADDIGIKKVNVVLNRISPLKKDLHEIKEAIIGKSKDAVIFGSIIRNRNGYKTSMQKGGSVFDYTLYPKEKEEMRGFVAEALLSIDIGVSDD